MKWIRISEAIHRAIAESAIRRQPDGSWLVPVSDEVADRLDEVRLAGESDDDLIMRMIREHRGDKPS